MKKEIFCLFCEKVFRTETGLSWHLAHTHGKVGEDEEIINSQDLPEAPANQKVMLDDLQKREIENPTAVFEKTMAELENNQGRQPEIIQSDEVPSQNIVFTGEPEVMVENDPIDAKLLEEGIEQPNETETRLDDYENLIKDLTADNVRLNEELVAAKEALFSPEHQQAVLNEAANNLTYENWLELGRRLGFQVPREAEKEEVKENLKSEPKTGRIGIKVRDTIFYSQ